MNQKVMQISFHHPGEVSNGDILQCPICRKKFLVLPGLQQYKIDGGVDVVCSNCAKPTRVEYYQELSRNFVAELPQRRRRKKVEGSE